MALAWTQLLTKMSAINLPGDKGRPACKADSLTPIFEPIVYKMCETSRLTNLWASTACYLYFYATGNLLTFNVLVTFVTFIETIVIYWLRNCHHHITLILSQLNPTQIFTSYSSLRPMSVLSLLSYPLLDTPSDPVRTVHVPFI
jgi:hypothetical protein